MKQTLTIGIIVVLVIVGLYFLMQDDDVTDNTPNETNTTQEDSNVTDETNTTDSTDDTTPANNIVLAEGEGGNFATVASATLVQPGFISIYKVNSNGDTSHMGSTDLLEAGTYSDVRLQLSNVVAEGETIVAVLHEDDGSGEFETGSDQFLTSDGGQLTSDIDVVGVEPSEEDEALKAQAEAFLEASVE